MRRRFLSRALSILLCLAVGYSSVPPVFVSEARAAAEPDDSGAKELIDDGIEAYQAGKYDEAVSKLTQARKLAPTNSPTVLYLGLAYLKQGALVIDVRSPGEFAAGHLAGAINVPLDQLEAALPQRVRDKNQVLLLQCASGTRSSLAKSKLRGMGYPNAFNLGSYGRAEGIVSQSN